MMVYYTIMFARLAYRRSKIYAKIYKIYTYTYIHTIQSHILNSLKFLNILKPERPAKFPINLKSVCLLT